MPLTSNLRKDLENLGSLTDYIAVESLWNILVKLAHCKNNNVEFRRLQLLVADLDSRHAEEFVQHPAVNVLLDLQPPLETVVVDKYERLETNEAAKEIASVRSLRQTDSRAAAKALLSLLKRIRNKRVHGFKTSDGPRDAEILGAARQLLQLLCERLVTMAP